MNTATQELRTATSANQIGRLHYYASGERGGAVDLKVDRERNGTHTVLWNANKGRGWFAKGWKCTVKTEADALAFVATKWPTMIAWLEALEPVAHDGAAAAFSAQVASMHG